MPRKKPHRTHETAKQLPGQGGGRQPAIKLAGPLAAGNPILAGLEDLTLEAIARLKKAPDDPAVLNQVRVLVTQYRGLLDASGIAKAQQKESRQRLLDELMIR